ncbi:MAG: radical SAM protein [candidate division Zixibacteria bacterium]|nr:radical SAM protein [candidate division Zixibacteria bacterium]
MIFPLKNITYRSWRYRMLYLWRFIATLSYGKIYNFILNRLEYKQTKVRLRSYPSQVIIDITNICNLKCPLCPTGTGKIDRQKGKMSPTSFDKITDQLANKAQAVHLYNWGEPLLLGNFADYCKIAKSKGFVISTSSNLSMKLDQERANEIIEAGPDRIIVSFDGLTERTYSMYRQGGSYQLLLDNLKLIIQSKKILRKKYPLIVLQFLKHRGNQSETQNLPEVCYDLGADEFQVVDILLPYGEGSNRSLANYWITENRLANEDGNFEIRKNDQDKPCPHLWKYPVINHDATISPCCFVYLKRDDIAELRYINFQNAWNSKRYQTSRKMFANRKYTDCQPCSSCPVFRSFIKSINT